MRPLARDLKHPHVVCGMRQLDLDAVSLWSEERSDCDETERANGFPARRP